MAKASVPVGAPTVAIKLKLPEGLHDHYAERAAKYGRDVEDELLIRLRDTRDYTATSPIYLDDDARQELTQIAGHLIRTQDELLTWARKLTSLKVEQVEVTLGQTLTTRLATRCFGATWEEHIRRTVIRCLEAEVGLR